MSSAHGFAVDRGQAGIGTVLGKPPTNSKGARFIMTSSTSARYVCAVTLLLTGCGGGQSAQLSPVQPGNLPTLALVRGAAREGNERSWMDPNAKKERLLYISDSGTNDVYVYSYGSRKLQGTLTGFNAPQGECVDNMGDVWITNLQGANVVEYAHGGPSPIATLSDAGEFPEGCAVDKMTGALAVSNLSAASGPGGVSIWKNAQGAPATYSIPNIVTPFFLGYDNGGDLFVDGLNSNGVFQLARLANGGSKFHGIALRGASVVFPGGVQWGGTNLAVGDRTGTNGPVIYQVRVRGNIGTVVGSTPLLGTTAVGQFFIERPNVVAPDLGGTEVGFWKYPGGGSATNVITGFATPVGTAVSDDK